MAGAGDIAIKIVMDLTGVTTASRQFESSMKSITSSVEGASAVIGKFAVAAGVVGVAIAAIVAAANFLKGSFDSLLQWGAQLDTLQNVLGVSSKEASKMAISMKAVGLSVDEGTAAFSYLARNIADADRKTVQAGIAMTTAAKDAGEQQAKVAQDLAKTRTNIARDLSDRLTDIQSSLNKNLLDMERSHGLSLNALAKDAFNIEQDYAKASAENEANRAKSLAKLEIDTTKSINKINSDLKDALRNSHSAKDRRQLRRQAAERRKEIMDAAAERRAEIETAAAERQQGLNEQRAERQQDLAERKQLLIDEFEYRKQQARESAAESTAAAQKSAAEQRQNAIDSAKEQSATIAKALDKQLATTREQLKNDPFMQAVEKLNISLYDTEGRLKPVNVLMEEIRTKLNELPDGVARTNAEFQLFGKSGGVLREWLRLSADEVERLYQANKKAYELTPEQINQAKQLQIKWAEIALAVESIGMTLAISILPNVIALTQWVTDNLLPAIREINQILGQAGPLLNQIMHPTDTQNPFAQGIFDWLNKTAAGLEGRASGGYIGRTQPYLLHAGEYVLNPQQTRELAPALAGNSYNFSNVWNGSVSGADRGSIERWAEEASFRGIAKAMRAG